MTHYWPFMRPAHDQCSIEHRSCRRLTDGQSEPAEKDLRTSLIGRVHHDTADKERYTGIETADMFTMHDVGNAIAVEQAFNHRELPDVLCVGEMNHPHQPSTSRTFTRVISPVVALRRPSFYTPPVTEFP